MYRTGIVQKFIKPIIKSSAIDANGKTFQNSKSYFVLQYADLIGYD